MTLVLFCSLAPAALLNTPYAASRPALHGGARSIRAVAGGPEFLDTISAFAHAPMLLADETTAPAARMTEEAIRAANGELGWWGTYIKTVEDGIINLHDGLESKSVPYPYGVTIFLFVLGVKLLTLPLNWNQLSSAANMKAIKPQQDRINKWYGDNKQLQQMEIANLFDKLDINPLAGCLPSLAQIPAFLGVYYSVTSIAKAKIFEEGFLWIPNLSGPIADRREGISWLTDNWVNGAPPLGWEDSFAYITLPLILIGTQTAALYLLGSFDAIDDGKEETKNVGLVLKFLPLMLGWFALNAPSGLALYWVFNNILTTSQTVLVKKIVAKDELDVPFDLAALGPRREELPFASAMAAPDWVKASAEMDVSGEVEPTALPAEA